MFVAFYGVIACACFMIGNVAPELLIEEFQDQTFEESQLFLRINKASHLEHVAPIVIFLSLFYRIRTAC
jgi:hypothetical protein